MVTDADEYPDHPPTANDLARLVDAAAELDALRAWKTEALTVLAAWDKVFDAMGRPGPLGHLKPANVLTQVIALKALVVCENEPEQHYQKRESGTCSACGDVWPCQSLRLAAILNGYPDPEPT